MEEVTCEMSHEGAHPVKGGEEQREDGQSHTGLKSLTCLGLCKSLMSRVSSRYMRMGET